MRYSRAIKESVIRKVLPPESRSIREVSAEYGVSEQSIRNWIDQANLGTLTIPEGELGPKALNIAEKYQLLLESATKSDEERGSWLREKGLHAEHLTLWNQEIRAIVTEKNDQQRQELQAAKKRIKNLEKELNRKDKALAEMAALIALKKKLQSILGDDEDD
ncbi:MAG: transposase [Armatimonadota bacterium]